MKNRQTALTIAIACTSFVCVSFAPADARGGGGGGMHGGGVPRADFGGYHGDAPDFHNTMEGRDFNDAGGRGWGDRPGAADRIDSARVGSRYTGEAARANEGNVINPLGGGSLFGDGARGTMGRDDTFDWSDRAFDSADMGAATRMASDGGCGRALGATSFGDMGRAGNFTQRVNPTESSRVGNAVRNSYDRRNLFNNNWWNARHDGWWYPWMDGYAWGYTPWNDLAGWWGVSADDSNDDYDYGTNITYNNDQVYNNSQPVASAEDYYDQALDLAQTPMPQPQASLDTDSMTFGPQGLETPALPPQQSDWKPFGVFSLVQGTQTNSTTMFQLMVNKAGIIRGNYYNALTNTTQPVSGAVDKKTMRAAWTVANNQTVVYDTGVSNLMKPQSPILVHFGKDKTEQFTLVRLEQPKTTATTK
jgi:hypothetical protein